MRTRLKIDQLFEDDLAPHPLDPRLFSGAIKAEWEWANPTPDDRTCIVSVWFSNRVPEEEINHVIIHGIKHAGFTGTDEPVDITNNGDDLIAQVTVIRPKPPARRLTDRRYKAPWLLARGDDYGKLRTGIYPLDV